MRWKAICEHFNLTFSDFLMHNFHRNFMHVFNSVFINYYSYTNLDWILSAEREENQNGIVYDDDDFSNSLSSHIHHHHMRCERDVGIKRRDSYEFIHICVHPGKRIPWIFHYDHHPQTQTQHQFSMMWCVCIVHYLLFCVVQYPSVEDR